MNTITIAPLAAQAAALGGNGYADQNTPLGRHCWYVAALALRSRVWGRGRGGGGGGS